MNTQDNPWHTVLLEACMAIESGYVPDDPYQTLQNILNWHCEIAVENTINVNELVILRDKLNDLITGD